MSGRGDDAYWRTQDAGIAGFAIPESKIAKAEPKMPISDIGVIIGRFQTPELHAAHRAVIDYVMARHKRVYILLGCGPVPATHRNPLDFSIRAAMIRAAYGRVDCVPISDMKSDDDWSVQVDNIVGGLAGSMSVTLYGGSDSFIPHYVGRFKTQELSVEGNMRATQAREMAAVEVRSSPDFRAGVIHGIYRSFPNPMPTVDMAPVCVKNGEPYVLMGKRDKYDPQWRFLGGFVECDESLEEAAARELDEEGGVRMFSTDMKYICSSVIRDWRYRGEKRNILTSFFGCLVDASYFNVVKAGDDIAAVGWVALSGLGSGSVIGAHEGLRIRLLNNSFWGEKG